MSLPLHLEAYQDCVDVFDQALTKNGARIKFATVGEAGQFQMRMHQARSLLRDRSKRLYKSDDPAWGSSEYDRFIIRRPRDDTDGFWWVYIEPAGSNILAIESLDEAYADSN